MLHSRVGILDELVTPEQHGVEADLGQSAGERGCITQPGSTGQLVGRQGWTAVEHQHGVPVRVHHDPADLDTPGRRLPTPLVDIDFGIHSFHGSSSGLTGSALCRIDVRAYLMASWLIGRARMHSPNVT